MLLLLLLFTVVTSQGSRVLINNIAICRSADYYENPLSFDPSRYVCGWTFSCSSLCPLILCHCLLLLLLPLPPLLLH